MRKEAVDRHAGVEGIGIEECLAMAVDGDHAGVIAAAAVHELSPMHPGQVGSREEEVVIVEHGGGEGVAVLPSAARVIDAAGIELVEVGFRGGKLGMASEVPAHAVEDGPDRLG